VQVTTVPPVGPGMVSGYLVLKTSSAETPTINVPVYAFERPTVTVSPSQIFLPTAPLGIAMQYRVTIQNFSANALALSDAKINLPGVEVKVSEVQPGKVYSLAVNFPAGVSTTPEQNVALTVKSSHPRFPLLQVPVYQRQPASIPVAVPMAPVAAPTNLPGNMRFVPAGN
jgi:hypothetical protein